MANQVGFQRSQTVQGSSLSSCWDTLLRFRFPLVVNDATQGFGGTKRELRHKSTSFGKTRRRGSSQISHPILDITQIGLNGAHNHAYHQGAPLHGPRLRPTRLFQVLLPIHHICYYRVHGFQKLAGRREWAFVLVITSFKSFFMSSCSTSAMKFPGNDVVRKAFVAETGRDVFRTIASRRSIAILLGDPTKHS